jgi:hypothetical protein
MFTRNDDVRQNEGLKRVELPLRELILDDCKTNKSHIPGSD